MPKIQHSFSIKKKQQLEAFQAQLRGKARPLSDFECLKRLGEGHYGIIYRAKDKKSDDIVVLKEVCVKNIVSTLSTCNLKDISTLTSYNHENMVKFKELALEHSINSIFLVMEYCEHNLATVRLKMAKPFLEAEVKCIILEVLKGLAHLHDRNIIHRYLSASNIFITNKGCIKIADFDFASKFIENATPFKPKLVKLWYRAPEFLYGTNSYTTGVDMWALGCILGELLLNEPLLPGSIDVMQLRLIVLLIGAPPEKMWANFMKIITKTNTFIRYQSDNNLKSKFNFLTPNGLSLLEHLLKYDPNERISAHMCLASFYFKEEPLPCDPNLIPTIKTYLKNYQYVSQQSANSDLLANHLKKLSLE